MITTPNGPVRLQGESGVAARLVPVTVDGLILAAPEADRISEGAALFEREVDAKPGTREVACGHTEPEQPQDFALRGQRKRKIRIPETWPWAHQLATCIELGLTLDLTG